MKYKEKHILISVMCVCFSANIMTVGEAVRSGAVTKIYKFSIFLSRGGGGLPSASTLGVI